jgi:hypothetical protein
VVICPVLAHQWGWDELLYFGLPVLVVLAGVRWVERRAKAKRDGDGEPVGEPSATMPGRDDPPGSES